MYSHSFLSPVSIRCKSFKFEITVQKKKERNESYIAFTSFR